MEAQSAPPIAVVVMAYGLRPTLAAAVASIVSQQPRAEIVVVHSGAGDPDQLLANAGMRVPVIRSDKRLLPGGARNVGIAATRAPIVAFLADDCIARPCWLAARLAAHADGAASVASALLCHQPQNPVALAAHLSLYVLRLPGTDANVALRYGASYCRTLFNRYGLFREDLEGGEDTEFHQRLSEAERPVWRPEIQTIHTGPEALGAYLKTHWGRGRRMAESMRALSGVSASTVAKSAIKRTGWIIRESLRYTPSTERLAVKMAVPFIALGNMAYALGALANRGDA